MLIGLRGRCRKVRKEMDADNVSIGHTDVRYR